MNLSEFMSDILAIEFEVKCLLNYPNAEQVINSAEQLNLCNEKKGSLYLRLAGVVISSGSCLHPQLSIALLRKALAHFTSALNYILIADCYRKLITLLSKEEALTEYETVSERIFCFDLLF